MSHFDDIFIIGCTEICLTTFNAVGDEISSTNGNISVSVIITDWEDDLFSCILYASSRLMSFFERVLIWL